MRRAARVDDNQKQIVESLRRFGASVYPTHMVGRGFPDIVVGYRGLNYLFEIKDGEKVPSKQRLTKDELAFFEMWKGSVYKVTTVDECISIMTA